MELIIRCYIILQYNIVKTQDSEDDEGFSNKYIAKIDESAVIVLISTRAIFKDQ